jgi:hypothetical protein
MSRAIFINWRSDSEHYIEKDLFQIDNLTDYGIAFFDPLNFALENNLRENSYDLSLAEYVRFDKDHFMTLMSNIKRVTDIFNNFFNNDGILVVRSNIPNSHIQVRKSAIKGTQKYTESVLPAFFWFEEFIGRFSFSYHLCNSMEFIERNNALCRKFAGEPISCWQSQDIISKGKVTVLGRGGQNATLPVVTMVSLLTQRGNIFFIPEFNVADESQKLVEAFSEITVGRDEGLLKPGWLGTFEKELEINNPYEQDIYNLITKIEMYNKQKVTLLNKHHEILNLIGLLYKDGENLALSVLNGLKFLGFQCNDKRLKVESSDELAYMIKNGQEKALVIVIDTKTGPMTPEMFDRINSIVDSLTGANTYKVIVVANTDCTISPDQRPASFPDEVLEINAATQYCLISTPVLYDIVTYLWYKSKSELFQTIQASLRKDLLSSIGEFIIDERKYLVNRTTGRKLETVRK